MHILYIYTVPDILFPFYKVIDTIIIIKVECTQHIQEQSKTDLPN